ncbi:M50 family metallopeptidase [Bacillus horti]|uniref:Stage IV sporulation protein FB n=1 Tax=Caldalkalibacillus horti TaxID=77523 RepID=A0ABT9VTU9_9BACI|nr:M50 family metallopeptidase [Bacillus horti]MDQ0164282.1 stage IV sporulation protein FB [Bacillus horti]
MIKLSIHPLFFFVILLAFLHGFIYDVLLLFAIVLVHECGHAGVAYTYGWRIKKIELLPFGGVAVVEEHGNKPFKEELLVLLAGPLMNMMMIGIACLFWTLKLWSTEFCLLFIEYNLIILLFNLLPIWPLDGGKLVQLLLSLFFPYKRAIQVSLFVSSIALIGYILMTALLFPVYFYLWSVAVFLLISLFLEFRQSPYQYLRFLLSRYHRKGENQKTRNADSSISGLSHQRKAQPLIIRSQDTVKESVERLFKHKKHYFYVTNQRGMLIHMLDEDELLQYYFERKWIHRAVGDVLG